MIGTRLRTCTQHIFQCFRRPALLIFEFKPILRCASASTFGCYVLSQSWTNAQVDEFCWCRRENPSWALKSCTGDLFCGQLLLEPTQLPQLLCHSSYLLFFTNSQLFKPGTLSLLLARNLQLTRALSLHPGAIMTDTRDYFFERVR